MSAAGGVADPYPLLEITAEPFDGRVSRTLVAALMDDLDERYARDDVGDGDSHEMMAQFAVRAHQVTPPVGIFLVARLDGEPVGCGAVRRVIGGPADVAEIKRMYTVPAARRRGVSRALLARLEAEAAALGYATLQLETGIASARGDRPLRDGRVPPHPVVRAVRGRRSVGVLRQGSRALDPLERSL